tara:strand:- start:169 stop:504 length:336 start_codon:yes stop_codon:yes gene_type:complete
MKIAANRNYRNLQKRSFFFFEPASESDEPKRGISDPKDLGFEITQEVKEAVQPFFSFVASLEESRQKEVMGALRKLLTQDPNVVMAVMEEITRMRAEASDPHQEQRMSPLY